MHELIMDLQLACVKKGVVPSMGVVMAVIEE